MLICSASELQGSSVLATLTQLLMNALHRPHRQRAGHRADGIGGRGLIQIHQDPLRVGSAVRGGMGRGPGQAV